MEISLILAILFFPKPHMQTNWTWDGSKAGNCVFDATEPCEGGKKEESILPMGMLLSWFRICERVGQLIYTQGHLS